MCSENSGCVHRKQQRRTLYGMAVNIKLLMDMPEMVIALNLNLIMTLHSFSASEMTYIVFGGTLNSTHSLTHFQDCPNEQVTRNELLS